MAGKTAILAVRIIGDGSNADKALNRTGDAAGRMGSKMQTATRAATVVGASLIGVAVAARQQASELQQANGAVEAVFKSQSTAVQNLAKTAATSLGLTRSEYSQTAAVLGAQLKNMGVATKNLVPQTDELIRLGGDLAATYGGKTSEAVAALSSLLRGETDPIERYAVGIKQADIAAQLAAKGEDKLTGAAKKAATTRALLELLEKQTADARGQRARESESDAQRQEVAIAKLKDTGASLGVTLLPAFAALAGAVATSASFMEQHADAVKIAAAVIAGMVVTVYAVNAAMKIYAATTAVVRAAVIVFRNAQLALNLAMMANPIGLIIAAVLLLIAGFVLLYKNSETFRKAVQAVGKIGMVAINWIVTAAKDLWGWISTKVPAAFTKAKDIAVKALNLWLFPIKTFIGYIQDLVGWIKRIKWPSVPKAIARLFGRGGPPSPVSAGISGGTAQSTLPGRGGPGGGGFFTNVGGGLMPQIIQITVNGALDPDSVARQIENLLAGRVRRLGGVTS